MAAPSDARAHLAKAREFFTVAELNLDLELYNVAASDAVISGINSKDAICLRLTGTTAKTENHAAAAAELRTAGGSGPHGSTTKQMATVLGRLLKLKSKSRYQTIDVAHADAAKAVEWAQKMLDGASSVSTRPALVLHLAARSTQGSRERAQRSPLSRLRLER